MSTSRILVIDAQMAGVAGDMFVAALIDLGAKADVVVGAMEATSQYIPNCKSIRVTPKPVQRSHVGGLYLDIEIKESYHTRKGEILIEAVKTATKELRLSSSASKYAQRAIQTLVESEAKVHRHSVKEVHLHAAGSADTVIDIIGAATALDQLDLADQNETSYYVLPIAVGGGTFPSSHGQLAAPGPAVTEILTKTKLLFKGGPLKKELATPTGVSLIAALTPTSTPTYPALRPKKTGYGAGTMDLPNVPNLLRLVLGTPLTQQQSS
ncbi:MAG: nickel insertion protein [Promethearchaeota archaeon]